MDDGLFETVRQTLPQVTIASEPVYSILMTISLLTQANAAAQVEPAVAEMAAQLSDEQKRKNGLIFRWLGAALLAQIDYPDFDHYLDALEAQPADTLLEPVQILADQVIPEEARPLLDDRAATKNILVTHLRTIWETIVAPVWKQRQGTVQSMVTLLKERALAQATPSDTLRAFIRRDIPDEISLQLAGVQHIIFVPTPFIRLHASRFGHPDTIWVFVLADYWSLPLRTEPIKRSEVLSPLRALADETRLRILELLAAHDVLLAQEIIARLEVSQPTVSRHLKQLVQAQIISEEKGPDANKLYRLNPNSIEALYHTLKGLLSPKNAQTILNDIRPTLAPELRRFLDREGKITIWPRKYKDKRTLMTYLIEKFERGQDYTEAEVNGVLLDWHTFEDQVTLRRALIDAQLLGREGDGSRYWRTEIELMPI